uniref:hypothetical protein n=1 Tax=uncultured Polaribacter sp. TaxID=174711 RepID=UPI0026083671|nr:hypothetical protein [uncultured Polaribacter sp.]
MLIQAQNIKVPENKIPNLSYSNTFSWNPSDKKYGIDAEIEFSLSYYDFENKYGQQQVLVAQNVKITKGNTIYNQGKTYTKQQVGEKAYNQIRVSEVDFKVTITNGTRSVEVFFMDVLPQKEDHVRQFGWADVFYGDYHPDRKPLDHSTTEKYEASIKANKKMLYSSNTRITNVELLDVKSYNIPDDRATKKKENVYLKKRGTKTTITSNDDFWNGNSDKNAKKTSKNNDNDFWNGKSKKIADKDKEDDFWNGKKEVDSNELVDEEILSEKPKTSLGYKVLYKAENYRIVQLGPIDMQNDNPEYWNPYTIIDENGNDLLGGGVYELNIWSTEGGYVDIRMSVNEQMIYNSNKFEQNPDLKIGTFSYYRLREIYSKTFIANDKLKVQYEIRGKMESFHYNMIKSSEASWYPREIKDKIIMPVITRKQE